MFFGDNVLCCIGVLWSCADWCLVDRTAYIDPSICVFLLLVCVHGLTHTPKSKTELVMNGQGILDFFGIGEEYEVSFPALYVRGLLLGTMRMEIAGVCVCVCVCVCV